MAVSADVSYVPGGLLPGGEQGCLAPGGHVARLLVAELQGTIRIVPPPYLAPIGTFLALNIQAPAARSKTPMVPVTRKPIRCVLARPARSSILVAAAKRNSHTRQIRANSS